MNIKINRANVNKKVKNQPFFPSQYVAIPLWIIEELIYRKRSSIVKTMVILISRYTLGMRSECCFFSFRKLAKMTGHSAYRIQEAVKECRELGYISEEMISAPEVRSLGNGTKAYRLNLIEPYKWKSPAPQRTFFEAYNLTRSIEDIRLKMEEKKIEDNPDVGYLIEKTKGYLKGKISKKDFEDVLFMFEKRF